MLQTGQEVLKADYLHEVTRPHMKVVTVTPELAHEWLSRMPKNRRLKKTKIIHLGRLIAGDMYMLNGEAIKFDWNNELRDGQHRLHAVIAANKPIQTCVIYDLNPAAFATMDLGTRRSNGDFLYIDGEVNSKLLSGAALHIWRYKSGLMATQSGNSPSYAEVKAILGMYPEVREHVLYAEGMREILNPASCAAFRTLMFKANPQQAEEFFEALKTGANLLAGDPRLLLRERLLKNRATKKSKLHRNEEDALIIKAWNHFLAGETPKFLRWHSATNEAFPVIVGLDS
jgi:hypothetical protein